MRDPEGALLSQEVARKASGRSERSGAGRGGGRGSLLKVAGERRVLGQNDSLASSGQIGAILWLFSHTSDDEGVDDLWPAWL